MHLETIDRAGLERAQKGLLPKLDSDLRGGDEQREFLRSVATNPSELCGLVRSWGLTRGEPPPVPVRPLTEKEFTDPPWSTECIVAATWEGLPPRLAARPETWFRIHVEMIEQRRIKSSYLAANGNGESGRARIAQALNGTDAQAVDRCVRNALRRLGGVIEARANRTAFLDCPLAKAWWRNRYAQEAHLTFERASVEVLSEALRKSFRWSKLVEAMISRLTVIGDRAIRPAIVQSMAQGVGGTPDEMEDVLRWIGRQSTIQALGFLGPHYVLQLITETFAAMRRAS